MKLDRRTLLRGSLRGALVGVGLPTLDAMLNGNGTAFAQGAPLPRRFGDLFFGGGVKNDRWLPSGTDAGWQLSPALMPFANVKSYITVVSNTRSTTSTEGHHGGTAAVLAGSSYGGGVKYQSFMTTPTVDQVAAEAIGKTTKFKSLEVGIAKAVNTEGNVGTCISHSGPNLLNKPERDPVALYNRLFGTGFVAPAPTGTSMTATPAPAIADKTLAVRRSVLDAVASDAESLKQRLGARDRVRLDQFLDGVRSLEQRITTFETASGPALAGAACKKPAAPNALSSGGGEPLEGLMGLMGDLLVVAMACDLTRVFSIQFTEMATSTIFAAVGDTKGIHPQTHEEAEPQPIVHACATYVYKQVATFLEKLKATPEGAGNLLDNLALMVLTEHNSGFAHDTDKKPIVIAGRAGGGLKFPGVHYASNSRENCSKVHLTVLKALGAPVTQFGGDSGLARDVIPSLLA
jgi:hypothetical protein